MTSGKSGASDAVRQFTVQPDDAGIRLDRWFKRHLADIGFATISRWARTGQIRVDGKRADPADRLEAGQTIRIPPGSAQLPDTKGAPRQRAPLTAEQIDQAEAMVLEKDRAAIILNKPPGLATQGGSGTKEHVDGLLDAYTADGGPRPRLVHRLDKDTSGVLLIARTPGSAAFFSKRFSGRTARKIYWALVVGVPSVEEGMIDLPLAKQPGSGGEKMMVDQSGEGQTARSKYRVIDRAGNRAAWVELQPLTGRTHQLRVHMAAIGFPIVGDGKYGGPAAFLTGSISRKMHLHARRLRLEHPDGDWIDARAPLPEHFAASLVQLGFDEADGDLPLDEPAPPSKMSEKRASLAHSKDMRRARKGERRSRGSESRGSGDGAPKGKGPGRPGAKSARGKPSGKLASKPASQPSQGRPSQGKPSQGKPSRGKPIR